MLNNFLQPGIILIVFGLLLLVLPSYFRKGAVILGPIITIVSVLTFESDRLAFMFALIFSIISLVGGIYNMHTKDRFELSVEAIYAGSSISVVYAVGWIDMLIFWELMAVASWLIVLCGKTKKATKAGFRYLLVHMLGGNLLLAGIVMKLASGSTAIECLTGTNDAAFWLILLGVAVNAAIPPLNAWIADAYPESTMGGTVYMGSFTTKVGVYCLIKIFAGTQLLLYFGVFMAVWGACMALIENDLRRLFAYHIISQVGYMVAALAIGSPAGIDGAAAHAFNNILYKGTLLMCAGTVINATGKRKISQLGGLGKKMPLVAICFLIASMAIAGFPLLNGFNSKSLIMNAAAESYHWAEILLMVASIGTLMSVTLKINYFVFWGKTDTEVEVKKENITFNQKLAIFLGALGCIITGIFPNILYGLTPNGVDGHPFTVDHVTQYIQLFASAAVAFIMYLEHMKPKEKLTLDTDWFYRKPLNSAIDAISTGFDNFRCNFGNQLGFWIKQGNDYLHNPMALLEKYFGIKPPVARDSIETDDVLQKPAGWLVAINFIMLFILAAYAFLNI